MTKSLPEHCKCLFSAPYEFLPKNLRDQFTELMLTRFQEVWQAIELKADPAIEAWIVNPGQHFIVDENILQLFPNLKILITPSTGTNHIDKQSCQKKNIRFLSLLDDRVALESISASAEYTFVLMMNCLRKVHRSWQQVQEGRWRRNEDFLRGHELMGKNVGLVGFGRIGRKLANYCEAFSAQVSFYDPYVESKIQKKDSLNNLFECADIVCVCCQLNVDTKNMIKLSLLEKLKKNACFINTSRGEVVCEDDLATFLKKRPDVMAGLDVLHGETSNVHFQSPLLAQELKDQVIITPHIAGLSHESQIKAAQTALSLLKS
ncbi:MAG: hypothetical protein HYS98_04745 [Deltaproteobacteria bacterium]|nr:hypothetical protein [Deltaproteobacteria bacterium]